MKNLFSVNIFSNDSFSSLMLPFSDKMIFVANTIHCNTYSDEILHN